MEILDPWYNTKINDSDLKYISLALLGLCNMDCIFCYVGGTRDGKLKLSEIKRIIKDSVDLGLEKVQLSGGEPLLYKDLGKLLLELKSNDIEILMATNGTLITKRKAEMLADYNVKVGVSFETIDERLSDELSGRPYTLRRRLNGINNLIGAGYTTELPLNIIIKTLVQNFDTFLDTWEWSLEKNIQPILDRAIPGERCKLEWIIRPDQLKYLMDGIGKLQHIKHRIPFLNNEGCNRMACGMHIEVNGDVYPCAGIPYTLGNVRNGNSIAHIWETSKVISKLKNLKDHIHGPCKTCYDSDICSGCRAVAYATTGDLFASDSFCWKNGAGDKYGCSI